jgi:CDP-4-dehydro-6-deoxyglucose reductase, E3
MKPTEYGCLVKDFRMITSTVFELTFDTDHPFHFVAGQFVSVIIPGAGPKGRDLRRAYSIASAPEIKPVELCIKIVEEGPGTQYLNRLRPGDRFRMVAPYGDFVYKPRPGRSICFVATGTGIAPFRSIVMSNHYKEMPPQSAHCFFGVRNEDELIYLDLFQNHPSLHFVSAVSKASSGWKGFRGRVTDYMRTLDSSFPWLMTDYYLCGHGGMIQEVKTMLLEKGVTKDSIHQEIYYK